jgi:hypothetical protein
MNLAFFNGCLMALHGMAMRLYKSQFDRLKLVAQSDGCSCLTLMFDADNE